jgi:hypothetical protein
MLAYHYCHIKLVAGADDGGAVDPIPVSAPAGASHIVIQPATFAIIMGVPRTTSGSTASSQPASRGDQPASSTVQTAALSA